MEDSGATSEERIALLRTTCTEHARMYKDAMNGRGIDRHMFGLYVACKGLGYVSVARAFDLRVRLTAGEVTLFRLWVGDREVSHFPLS